MKIYIYDMTVSEDWTYSANIYETVVTDIECPEHIGTSYFNQVSLNRFLYNSFNRLLKLPGCIQFRSLVELNSDEMEKLMLCVGRRLKNESI